MKLVCVESPFAGNVELHLRYVRACMADCLRRGESPYASHALLAQPGVLDDLVPEERKLGIEAGFAWRACAASIVFYTDLGMSGGMHAALKKALEDAKKPKKVDGWTRWSANPEIRGRTLGAPWSSYPVSDVDWKGEYR